MQGTDRLLETLQEFCHPWRRLTIGIDGSPGAGKSTLARYLAWQLGIPALETDFWRATGDEPSFEQLRKLISCWHETGEMGRPVIVEGIKLLEVFERIGITPDFLVFVTNHALEPDPEITDWCGPPPLEALSGGIADYFANCRPQDKADFHLEWREPEISAH